MVSRNRKKRLMLLLSGVFAVTMVWFLLPSQKAETVEVAQVVGPKVTVFQLVRDNNRPEVELLGRVKARDNAVLKSQVQGQITSFHAKPGQMVKEGAILATINADDYQATFDRESARLSELGRAQERIRAGLKTAQGNLQYIFEDYKLAKKDYQRLYKLRKQGFGDQKNLDLSRQNLLRSKTDYETRQLGVEELVLQVKEAEAAIAQQEAVLRQAGINLARTQIKAPYDGIVTEKSASRGDFVSTGTAIVRLMNPYELLVTASLSYEEANRIGKDNVHAALVELPKYKTSNIALVGITGLENAAAEVHFSLSQKHLNLNNGEGVTVRLKLPEVTETYWIPESALFSRSYIYSLGEDKKLKSHKIAMVGHATQNNEKGYLIQVDGDLSGRSILNTPLPRVVDGMIVEPANT